jgi:hypothetical protein
MGNVDVGSHVDTFARYRNGMTAPDANGNAQIKSTARNDGLGMRE